MKILKPPAKPGNSFKERGLIAQALESYAKDYQKRTGTDYTTAWHNQVNQLAKQCGFQTNDPDEFKKWIFSQPLGRISLLQEPPGLFPFVTNEKLPLVEVSYNSEEAISSLEYGPPWDELAAYLSVFAGQAYSSEDAVELFMQEQGAKSFTWFSHKLTSVAAFGCILHGHPILCFKGTNTIRLGLIDALILPWGRPIRHMGFHLAWSIIKSKVIGWLESLSYKKGLILTGHSLGGAMAFLAAYDLCDLGIAAVITFGAPRPGMYDFKDKYASRCNENTKTTKPLGEITYRYTHETDIVSRVPPPLFFYHVGSSERVVKDDGTIKEGCPPNYLQRIDEINIKIRGMTSGLLEYTSIFPLQQGISPTKDACFSLLYSLYQAFTFLGFWGLYFFFGFLLALLIPLALIDGIRHKSYFYLNAFARRFKLIKTDG
jgi:hypothetical protein